MLCVSRPLLGAVGKYGVEWVGGRGAPKPIPGPLGCVPAPVPSAVYCVCMCVCERARLFHSQSAKSASLSRPRPERESPGVPRAAGSALSSFFPVLGRLGHSCCCWALHPPLSTPTTSQEKCHEHGHAAGTGSLACKQWILCVCVACGWAAAAALKGAPSSAPMLRQGLKN